MGVGLGVEVAVGVKVGVGLGVEVAVGVLVGVAVGEGTGQNGTCAATRPALPAGIRLATPQMMASTKAVTRSLSPVALNLIAAPS